MAHDHAADSYEDPRLPKKERLRYMTAVRYSETSGSILYRAASAQGLQFGTWLREAAVRESLRVLGLLPEQTPPMNPKNLKPCGANVLIRRRKSEAQTESGIHLPTKERETTIYCEVLAVGPECGRAKPGDTIVVVPLAGLELDVDDMAVIAEKDVLAVVTEAA